MTQETSYKCKLYDRVKAKTAYGKCWRLKDLGEGMFAAEKMMQFCYVTRFLINEEEKTAVELIARDCCWADVRDEDIRWEDVAGMSRKAREMAKYRDCSYPVIIEKFHDGKAVVQWQLVPEGRFWEDEDGFGATPDEIQALYGTIDKRGNVVDAFRSIPEADKAGYIMATVVAGKVLCGE